MPATVPGKPSVLVVDDEDDIRESIAEVLRQRLVGVKVFTAVDGKQALEIIRKERPTVIVSDYRMPGMNGIDLLRESRKIVPNARRLMISAYAETSLAWEALREADVALLVTKPFQLDYFVQVVATFVKQRPS